jgi:hypothetical protein
MTLPWIHASRPPYKTAEVQPAVELRASRRLETTEVMTLSTEEETIEVEVVDVSCGGLSVRASLLPGQVVMAVLRFAQGYPRSVRLRVVWAAGERCGLAVLPEGRPLMANYLLFERGVREAA